MKKNRFVWIAFLLCIGLALPVAAQTLDKGYYDYQGMINHQLKIRMSLYLTGQEITGSYFYEKHRKEIKLKGTLVANKVVLQEYDKNGRKTGIFEGYLQSIDSIDGYWSTPGGGRNYPFHLGLISSAIGAAYEKRYQDAGAENDAVVETFAANLQCYLANNQKQKIAALLHYPTEVKVNGKPITLKTPEQFLAHYHEVFYPEFKTALVNAFTKYLFSNYQGIMFGGDTKNIWIGCSPEGCFILKINN